MQASWPIARARRRLNDPSSDGRYSDADMLDALSTVCDQLMRDILFPDCHVTTQTVPFVQAYQLPEFLEIHAVYIQGRLCPPVPSKDVLEGNQILVYDQGGGFQGSPAGAPPIGGAGPSGNTGVFCPKWTVQTPAAFPNANEFSDCLWPAPSTGPWQTQNRPMVAIEGGYLIIVPAPSTGPVVINGEVQDNIDIRGVLPHEQVTDIDQSLWFPKSCLSPLAWGIVQECLFSDATQMGMTRFSAANQKYTQEKNQRRTDAKVYKNAFSIDQPKMITGRQYWNGQIRRQGSF
jgi:hypothetical protein